MIVVQMETTADQRVFMELNHCSHNIAIKHTETSQVAIKQVKSKICYLIERTTYLRNHNNIYQSTSRARRILDVLELYIKTWAGGAYVGLTISVVESGPPHVHYIPQMRRAVGEHMLKHGSNASNASSYWSWL